MRTDRRAQARLPRVDTGADFHAPTSFACRPACSRRCNRCRARSPSTQETRALVRASMPRPRPCRSRSVTLKPAGTSSRETVPAIRRAPPPHPSLTRASPGGTQFTQTAYRAFGPNTRCAPSTTSRSASQPRSLTSPIAQRIPMLLSDPDERLAQEPLIHRVVGVDAIRRCVSIVLTCLAHQSIPIR
jgi:hypothetical protein